MSFKKSHYLSIEALSPIYIGGAKEQVYVSDKDYYKPKGSGNVHMISFPLLLQASRQKNSKLFESQFLHGNLSTIQRAIKQNLEDENILKAATTKTYALGRIIPQEIRNPISDARGYAYLPGTAIKGAIRTALGALKLKDEKGSWQHNKPFGGIQSDPLRNLQVTDVYFSENPGGLFGQKIYCANFSNEVGLWKTKAKGGHEEYFDQKKFTNWFEAIKPKSSAILRINVLETDHFQLPAWLNPLKSAEAFIGQLQSFMAEFLRKELNFFSSFPNEDLGEAIEQQLEQLIELNSGNQAVVRFGAGTGKHLMTGMLNHQDFISSVKSNGELENKSRKIWFENHQGNPKFFLPGFALLKLTDGPFTYLPFGLQTKQGSSKPQATQATKPVLIDYRRLKDMQEFEGEVLSFEAPSTLKIKPFWENGPEMIEVRYRSSIEQGTIVRLEFQKVNKKQVKYEFRGLK